MTDSTTHRYRDDFTVTLPVQHARTQTLLCELAHVIRSEWNYPARDNINQLKPSSRNSTLIIEWNSKDDAAYLGGFPASLLKHGWAITGMKSHHTFVSPIRESAEADVEYRFEGHTTINIYTPKPCEVCGEREHVTHVEIYQEPSNLDERITNNDYIPGRWSTSMAICADCDLPDDVEPYEWDGEPDFNPDEHPDYNYSPTA